MDAVAEAFRAHTSRQGRTFPIVREKLSDHSVFGVKSGFLPERHVLGLKTAGYWKNNRLINQEAHQATIVLIDPSTGQPRAFIDGNYITTIRTGAAGALAADHFSRQAARVVAVIGTGVQGQIQTEGVLAVRPDVREVRCAGLTGHSIKSYVDTFQHRVQVTLCHSVASAVQGADIVVTATPSTVPFLRREYLKPGVHINAMGADTRGKSELLADVLQDATVFVDDLAQSRTIGELQKWPQCPAVEIGQVLLGQHPGRQRDDELTVFDSTGLALQDLTTAELVLERAVQQGLGTILKW